MHPDKSNFASGGVAVNVTNTDVPYDVPQRVSDDSRANGGPTPPLDGPGT
jgi:hypothetical protein